MNNVFSFHLITVLAFLGLLTACATPAPVVPRIGYIPLAQVTTKAKFETPTLTRENFDGIAKQCMSTWPDSATTRITSSWQLPLPRGTTQIQSHNGHASYLLVAGGLGTCIQQSNEKHPILAAEAFYKTANPGGVPPDIVDQWYATIAVEVARSGTATAIYKFKNGNAQIVKYWVEPSTAPPSSLSYWSEFKRTGEWTAKATDQVFEHPALASLAVTEYNNRRVKPFLSHRFD